MKLKISITSWLNGSVLFEFEKENNTIKDTVLEAIKQKANLEGAYLEGANLRGANLRGAYLRDANLEGAYLEGAYLRDANLEGANLEGANLRGANLRGANLRDANLEGANLEGANLRGAYLRDANLGDILFKNLPISYINLASRDMLFVFEHLKKELPFLKQALIDGKVDGTQYEGDCACLIGSLGKADGGIDKVCEMIPYYNKGLHNPGEQWFWQIHERDTPKTNIFAKHALKLIDQVLKKAK